MNRTAERVLSIIAAVLTAIGVIFSFFGVAIFNIAKNDPALILESDPTLTQAELDAALPVLDFIGGFMWLIIIGLVISVVLNIIGIVNIWNNKNAKLAGIMFIIAGVFGGILSLSSILLYVAAILCFTKKPPLQDNLQFTEPYDGDGMRPL